MTARTKRWMKAELDRLLAQREQYEVATRTAATPAQARRRTQRLAAIGEEILGREEALTALARHDDADRPRPVRRRTPGGGRPTAAFRALATQRAPAIGATLTVMTKPVDDLSRSLTKVVSSAFMIGFALTAAAMWTAGIGQTPTAIEGARAQRSTPAATSPDRRARPRPRTVDDDVLAAQAPARR